MVHRAARGGRSAMLCAVAALLVLASPAGAAAESAPDTALARGEYVFRTGDCVSCHTDTKQGSAALAGGRAIKTPFGTFYSPNITPDPATGIGRWNEQDFVRAMTEGVARDGSHLFPVFPYPAFTLMTPQDLDDLWTYLRAQPPVEQANRPHDLTPPFGWRFLIPAWNWLYFNPGTFQPDPAHDAQWNRGAYLVNGPTHCGECHTPRDWLGGPKTDMYLAGSKDGAEGALAPNITPDPDTGIGNWATADITWLLQTGLLPDGDAVEGLMAEAIDHSYQYLTDADRSAIAAYLKSIPPINHKLVKPKK